MRSEERKKERKEKTKQNKTKQNQSPTISGFDERRGDKEYQSENVIFPVITDQS